MLKRLIMGGLVLMLTACASDGPYVPLEKSPKKVPLQHSQRIVILDRNVRGVLILINSVQKRLAGGQILVQANFQNRYTNDDVWADVKFEFQDENSMVVDETEWVNTFFPRSEVTTVQGNSISGRAVKHVMLLKDLKTRTGRLPESWGNLFELPAIPVPVPQEPTGVTMKQTIYRWKIAGLILGAVFWLILSSCGLRQVPQTDTTYVETGYQGQLTGPTLTELKERFPLDFWKDQPLNIPPEKRLNIGIREFLPLTQPLELGQMVTEIFTTTFTKSKAFNIIERQQLDKILNEHELNQSGIIDPQSAQQIGHIGGLDAVVTGGISQIGNARRIDARVIDLKTGQVVLSEALTPVFDGQNRNLRPVDYQNIAGLARRLVDEMVVHYYR